MTSTHTHIHIYIYYIYIYILYIYIYNYYLFLKVDFSANRFFWENLQTDIVYCFVHFFFSIFFLFLPTHYTMGLHDISLRSNFLFAHYNSSIYASRVFENQTLSLMDCFFDSKFHLCYAKNKRHLTFSTCNLFAVWTRSSIYTTSVHPGKYGCFSVYVYSSQLT